MLLKKMAIAIDSYSAASTSPFWGENKCLASIRSCHQAK